MLQRIQSFVHKKFRKAEPNRYSILWALSGRLVIVEFFKDGIPARIEELKMLEHNNIPDLWFDLSKERQYARLRTVVNSSELWLSTCQPFKEPYELLEIDYNRLLSIGLKENLWFYFMVDDSWQHFRQAGIVITHIAEPLFKISVQHIGTLVSYLDSHSLWIATFNNKKNLFFFNQFEVSDKKDWIFWHIHITKLLKLQNLFLPMGARQEWVNDLKQYGEVLNVPVAIKSRQYEPNVPVERYVLMLNFK